MNHMPADSIAQARSKYYKQKHGVHMSKKLARHRKLTKKKETLGSLKEIRHFYLQHLS
jgi:hypothetical protein